MQQMAQLVYRHIFPGGGRHPPQPQRKTQRMGVQAAAAPAGVHIPYPDGRHGARAAGCKGRPTNRPPNPAFPPVPRPCRGWASGLPPPGGRPSADGRGPPSRHGMPQRHPPRPSGVRMGADTATLPSSRTRRFRFLTRRRVSVKVTPPALRCCNVRSLLRHSVPAGIPPDKYIVYYIRNCLKPQRSGR